AHWFRTQATADDTSALLAANQAGIRQHIEMLHHGRQRHRKRLWEFAHREGGSFALSREQRPPRGGCQRGESPIEVWSVIVNHLVKYRAARRTVKSRRIHISLKKCR